MIPFAVFAQFFIFQKLIISGDAAATVSNILANKMQFRAGITSFIIVIVLDILVAWSLFYFFRSVNRSFSLLMAWFRLVYAVIFAVALGNYMNVLQLLDSSGFLNAFDTGQLQTRVMLSLNAFNDCWAIGYVFFGLHLALLGYLIIRSGFVSRLLGLFVFISGLSYLIDHLGKIIYPDFNANLSMLLGWGELLFMLWLLIKGWRLPEAKKDK